jgi:dihydroneopterin aldolase
MNEREIFIKDWIIQARLGVYEHEKNRTQRLRLNLVFFQTPSHIKHLSDCIDYDAQKKEILKLIERKHYELLETLAEDIAALCLQHPLMTRISVQLEKLDIYDDCESCGMRLIRSK